LALSSSVSKTGSPANPQKPGEIILFGLFLFLVSLDVQGQGFVVDKAARPSELPQVAELFAIGAKGELECLPSQHGPIKLVVYAVVKRYTSRQALRLRIARPLGLRHKVSQKGV
jgi:hypothetical protein